MTGWTTSTTTDPAQRIGTHGWSQRTYGQLTTAERRQLLPCIVRAHIDNAAGRTVMLLRLNSGRRVDVLEGR